MPGIFYNRSAAVVTSLAGSKCRYPTLMTLGVSFLIFRRVTVHRNKLDWTGTCPVCSRVEFKSL